MSFYLALNSASRHVNNDRANYYVNSVQNTKIYACRAILTGLSAFGLSNGFALFSSFVSLDFDHFCRNRLWQTCYTLHLKLFSMRYQTGALNVRFLTAGQKSRA